MGVILSLLGGIAGLGSFVCFVIVLIKLFQEKGVLHGILGIITCGIYPFIWGWINAGRLNVQTIMMVWTACWVVSFLFGGASAAFQ
jgi:hypothetical protein